MKTIQSHQKSKVLRILAIVLFFLIGCSHGAISSTEKDKIKITVMSKFDGTGKTLITCILSNHSPNALASIVRSATSSAFYFLLKDESGEEISQNSEWMENFSQKGSKRYKYPRNSRFHFISNGEKLEFSFYLEDAYGAESQNGRNLIVSWESYYPDSTTPTNYRRNSEGKMVKGDDEKYMFPKDWSISTTLDLKKNE